MHTGITRQEYVFGWLDEYLTSVDLEVDEIISTNEISLSSTDGDTLIPCTHAFHLFFIVCCIGVQLSISISFPFLSFL